MNIYLIGFMGCGKSTLGKKLSNKLNYHFIDLDQYIEQQEKRTIQEIFEDSGESTFREMESQYLRAIPGEKGNYTIATGGGLPVHNQNMDYMNQQGLTIYLQMEPKQLFYRLKHAKTERPLLKNKNDEEVLEYIEQTLKYREPFYQQAKLTIKAFNIKINYLVEQIETQLGS